VVVAEGAYPGGAIGVQRAIQERSGFEVRTSILGHVQRGGTPSTRDRVLASRLGFMAVEGLLEGRSGEMVGVDKRGTVFVPLRDVWTHRKPVDEQLVELASILAI
jgi:6-phosphofructokinase 1